MFRCTGQEKDREEDRKPGGKTCVKERYIYGKFGVRGGGRTGQDKVEE